MASQKDKQERRPRHRGRSDITDEIGIGNELNHILRTAYYATFDQGEFAQLAHSAYEYTAQGLHSSEEETITISLPIGYKPTREPMISDRVYNKDELYEKLGYLTHTQLSINGIIHLAVIIEAMLTDLIRCVVKHYPAKLGSKCQISIRKVLEASSLTDLHLTATEDLLNELSYKSPSEFAEKVVPILSVNLLECPRYHKYIEMKATRDILIHSRGIANSTYEAKAGSHARVSAGQTVPVDQVYLLDAYSGRS